MTFEGKIEVELDWRPSREWLEVKASSDVISVTDPMHAPHNPAVFSGTSWNSSLEHVFGGACFELCVTVRECLETMLEACENGSMTQREMDLRCAEIGRVTSAVTRALAGNQLSRDYA